MGWYSFKNIHKYQAIYNMVIGQRSNGKTYAFKQQALENYIKKGDRCAYIRRYDTDIRPKHLSALFDVHIDYIKKATKNKWNAVDYKKNGFYLCIKEDGKVLVSDNQPFCDVYALNTWESAKGADNGPVTTICFDEFMTRKAYLTQEFVIFQNILSSIIRDRDNVTIYMLANTVNKYCPYFKEIGLSHVPDMKPGEIELYTFGESGLTVAVEMCAESDKTKKVKKFFAFDNPQLEMITSGKWEIALYPHPPTEVTKEDIVKKFYIVFDNKIICGDIMQTEQYLFILYHYHTGNHTPDKNDIMYLEQHDGMIMHCMYLTEIRTEAHRLIVDLIKTGREFYTNNEVGEVVRNWKLNALSMRSV